MAHPSSTAPYLSVVAASRNDDHGGDPLVRTQIFINCFARECELHQLPAELILVDWNPVSGRPGLAGMLQLPAGSSYCQARVITVPTVLHHQVKYADRLQFFQMIAKNVGIRRARGSFVLATNIDIIFSEELIAYISRRRLDPSCVYRVDRYDIQSGLTIEHPLAETLEYAWTHPVRANRRLNPKALLNHLYGEDIFRRHVSTDVSNYPAADGCKLVEDVGVLALRTGRDAPLEQLHTNACGDFTLLSREAWSKLTGYPEFEAFSMNIDSVGLAAAHYAGYEETALMPPCVCFHIEHSIGSGWTPEGEKKLFARLNEKEILNPEWHVLAPLVSEMRRGTKPTALNGPNWGLANFELPEQSLLPGSINASSLQHPNYTVQTGLEVCALLPEFDLDRLTLWQDRKDSPAERLTRIIDETRANLKRAEEYLRLVEKDAAARLAALEEYGARTKKMEDYILFIEKDRDQRLESIRVYQEKLKQAYADHEHNVNYIGRIHEDLAAHIKVIADKDALIASLNSQLQAAIAAKPANTSPV